MDVIGVAQWTSSVCHGVYELLQIFKLGLELLFINRSDAIINQMIDFHNRVTINLSPHDQPRGHDHQVVMII